MDRKSQKNKQEVDIKFLLISSFMAMVFFMLIGAGEKKFAWWGVSEPILAKGTIGVGDMLAYHLALLCMIVVFIVIGHSYIKQGIAFIVIFSLLGLYVFNSGVVMTNDSVVERQGGRTVTYKLVEIESYSIKEVQNQTSSTNTHEITLTFPNHEPFLLNSTLTKENLQVALEKELRLAKR